jgi:acetyl esterase/lipase
MIYDRNKNTIEARGQVQIYYQGRVLQADRVIYDQVTKRVHAQGNAKLTERDGTASYSDRFELTDDFKDGFVDSIRTDSSDKTFMTGARAEVYKTVGDTALSLYIFEPAGPAQKNRPAIVFFFGGGWNSGTPAQFEPQCRALAARGIVAITADYRVATRQKAKPVDCVADAKSAVRWLRTHAARLSLDPQRIAAAGGSAGGDRGDAGCPTDQHREHPHDPAGTGRSVAVGRCEAREERTDR